MLYQRQDYHWHDYKILCPKSAVQDADVGGDHLGKRWGIEQGG